jgi:hypothetical protein
MYQVCLLVIVFRTLSVVTGSVLPEKKLFLREIDGATQQNGTLNSGSAVDSVYWDVALHCCVSAFRRLEGK